MTVTPEKLRKCADDLEERFQLPHGTMDDLRQAAEKLMAADQYISGLEATNKFFGDELSRLENEVSQ